MIHPLGFRVSGQNCIEWKTAWCRHRKTIHDKGKLYNKKHRSTKDRKIHADRRMGNQDKSTVELVNKGQSP